MLGYVAEVGAPKRSHSPEYLHSARMICAVALEVRFGRPNSFADTAAKFSNDVPEPKSSTGQDEYLTAAEGSATRRNVERCSCSYRFARMIAARVKLNGRRNRSGA